MTHNYLNPAIRIEIWDSSSVHYTLMDTDTGLSSKNYALSADVSKHLNDRIGSFRCKLIQKSTEHNVNDRSPRESEGFFCCDLASLT